MHALIIFDTLVMLQEQILLLLPNSANRTTETIFSLFSQFPDHRQVR